MKCIQLVIKFKRVYILNELKKGFRMKLISLLLIVLFSTSAFSETKYSYFCIDKNDLKLSKMNDIDVSESNFVLYVETEKTFEVATYSQGDDNFDMKLVRADRKLTGSSFIFKGSNNSMAFFKERRALYGNNKVDAIAHVVIDGSTLDYGCFIN